MSRAAQRPEVGFPHELVAVADAVEARIDIVLTDEIARWAAIDPILGAPLEELRALVLAGGKRLRPAFCAAAYLGSGGALDDPILVDAGAAIELLHTFALVHDDIMDGSSTRRGRPAVHERFIAEHLDARGRGEARRFGEGLAILIGDFALVLADMLLRGAPAPVWPLWDELRLELCVGQSLDLWGASRYEHDLALAYRIVGYKSAKYTVERPLHLGAALTGRLDALADPLSRFGLPLGAAFQLRDDILGVFGDERRTGKPVGGDLRDGKPTPLLALARDRADPRDRAALARVGWPSLDDDDIALIQQAIERTGARDEIEAEIGRLVAEAEAALTLVPVNSGARDLLGRLARFVAWREH